jgi:hypothetical protein
MHFKAAAFAEKLFSADDTHLGAAEWTQHTIPPSNYISPAANTLSKVLYQSIILYLQ